MEADGVWAYLAILRRRLWVILLVFAVTMGVILARALTAPTTYTTSLVLQVIPLESEEVPLFTRAASATTGETVDLILYQFTDLVQSSAIALRTIAAAGVNMDPDELIDGINVQRDPGGDTLTISLTTKNSENVDKLLITLAEKALEEYRQGRARPSVAVGKFLEVQLTVANQELQTSQAELLRFKLQNGVQSIDREIQAEQDAIRALRKSQEDADRQVQMLTAMADELDKQGEAARQKSELFPSTSETAGMWRQIARDQSTAALNRRVEAAGQRAAQTGYYTVLSEHESNLASLLTLSERFQRLDDTVKEKQESRDFLAGKAREAQLKESQSLNIGYLQIIRQPTPARPARSARTLEIALLGGGLSLLAGAVLAFVLELLDQALRRRPTHGAKAA